MRAERVGADTLLARIVAHGGRGAAQSRADSAARRSRVWLLRSGRHRGRGRSTFVVWSTIGPEPRLAYARRQRGRGADHRVSVRARTGDADVDHGGDRPRRVAGRAVSERRGDRAARKRRHARRRQDRHADAGQAGTDVGDVGRGLFRRATCSGLRPRFERASEHPLAAAIVAGAAARGLAVDAGRGVPRRRR